MSNILMQDIIKGNFEDNSLPTIAFGDYDGVYDEIIEYIDSVGVGDDSNIYMASCYGKLESMEQNDSVILYSVSGLYSIKGLVDALKFLSILGEGAEKTAKVYVKNYNGYVLPVEEIIDDRDADRVVFVTQYQIVDSYDG